MAFGFEYDAAFCGGHRRTVERPESGGIASGEAGRRAGGCPVSRYRAILKHRYTDMVLGVMTEFGGGS